ncbi:MAG: fibronectin type III domain-containing protein [Bacteroidota bacterium]
MNIRLTEHPSLRTAALWGSGLLCCTMLMLNGCAQKAIIKESVPETPPAKVTLQSRIIDFRTAFRQKTLDLKYPSYVRIDTVFADTVLKQISIKFNQEISNLPFRENTVDELYSKIRNFFGPDFSTYRYSATAGQLPVEQLIPNFYRTGKTGIDKSRMPESHRTSENVMAARNLSKPYTPSKGLDNRNIGLWNSHGWYFNSDDKKWEWQRPRLFETVEDLLPTSFVIPYLIPMLENAGAAVYVPRERDIQTNEVIVDNDQKNKKEGGYKESYSRRKGPGSVKWTVSKTPGFGEGQRVYAEGVNPFRLGTSRFILSDTAETTVAEWIPDIPETGNYAVYISYESSLDNAPDAHYTVIHQGGTTEFSINQKMGGSTWIYLGNFTFVKGTSGKVRLSNKCSASGLRVSADAVRFGGGMGVVSREGQTSGRPKFVEGGRYFLQFAGMPDTLVYDLNKRQNDYNDDYQCRSEYLNYLYGAPFGPNRDRKQTGLGIPIDISLAFHTDAGVTKNDTTIGTLTIYSSQGYFDETNLPNNMNRMVNRDLSDIMHTQIVDDIRAGFDPSWSRRQMRDSKYSESYRPNMPAVLLELLSHQNFLDMKFAMDPRFRFTVSRAIYKAFLKFLAFQDSKPFVVQPLPVNSFSAILTGKGSVRLTWKPQRDPLEPTADAKQYIIYTRINDGGFDNGTLVNSTEYSMDKLHKGDIYSFRVAALNEGGESFPSEVLSVCDMQNGSSPALIVNAFDRICAPQAIESGNFSGFADFIDAGVPDKYAINFTGTQYDFNPSSPFISNLAPGHGASHADREGYVIAGNSFDYPFIHGTALRNNGLSFSSASDESVWDGMVDLKAYRFTDIIFGEEKETPWQRRQMDSLYGKQYKTFPDKFKDAVKNYLNAGGNLFISGAYIASDLFLNKSEKDPDVLFGKDVLKISFGADHASVTGNVKPAAGNSFGKAGKFSFNTLPSRAIYAVEAPDAIENVKGSATLLRYPENDFSAAVGYKGNYGVVTFGFPFETITGQDKQTMVMEDILKYLGVR